MSKTDEAFEEAVLALSNWLDFIEVKKKQTTEQLERAKRRAEKEGMADMQNLSVPVRDEDPVLNEGLINGGEPGPAEVKTDSWL